MTPLAGERGLALLIELVADRADPDQNVAVVQEGGCDVIEGRP